jgi:hypothetical protein
MEELILSKKEIERVVLWFLKSPYRTEYDYEIFLRFSHRLSDIDSLLETLAMEARR